jgi:hypothetical protein
MDAKEIKNWEEERVHVPVGKFGNQIVNYNSPNKENKNETKDKAHIDPLVAIEASLKAQYQAEVALLSKELTRQFTDQLAKTKAGIIKQAMKLNEKVEVQKKQFAHYKEETAEKTSIAYDRFDKGLTKFFKLQEGIE